MAESFCERILSCGRQAGGAQCPPQLQGGGVLDGGDSPHEPRLSWSTCASTRRTMSPARRLVGAVHEPVLANRRANLVGAVHEPVREPSSRTGGSPPVPARLGSFTVHGSRRVSREESVHGSRFADSRWGLVGSRFGVHGLGAGASWFTVHGSRLRRELRGLPSTNRDALGAPFGSALAGAWAGGPA